MHGFYSLFLQSVEQFPDRIAVELQRTSGALESHSYSQLRGMGESVGRWLCESGFSAGVRCAIMAGNGPLWVTAYLGVMSAGAVAVPLDTAFNAHQVNKLLWDCGASVIFTDAAHLPVVEKAVEETLVRIVMIDGSGEGRYSNLLGMLSAGPADFSPAPINDDDLAVIMYTSGTTADPKGVMLTHSNLLAEAEAVFRTIKVNQHDSILAVLPLFHALAQMANLLLPFAVGARIVYLEEMNTTELLRALSQRDITLFCCVPQFFYLIHERVMQEVKKRSFAARAAFRAMMAVSGASRKIGINLGRLFFARVHKLLGPKMRYLITGGSAFDPRIGHDLQQLGFNVLQAYGLTETSGGAFVTRPENNVLGSVGQPLWGVQVKIIAPQPVEGAPFPVGEVAIAGGIVMKGYYNRPDATRETIHDGWLYSGDLGYLDQRGMLFITGRKKEIIVLSSGKNIYPEEIEAHYLHSPFIKEICVMGMLNRPGEPFSERLHAVIVPNFDVLREKKIVNAREVIRFDVENLSMQLPSTKRILSFDLWPDPLPRTTTRKLKRFEIQKRVLAGERSGAAESSAHVAEEPTAEEAIWLSQPEVQSAITAIRDASKSQKPVTPSSNLELDLGFDSMERVELVVALERELGAEADDKVISQVYTVRELVDAILSARTQLAAAETEPAPASPNGSKRPALPGWDAVLAAQPGADFNQADASAVYKALHTSVFFTFIWFVLVKFAGLIVRIFFGLRVSGREKLPRKGPFILSPNHQSFLDGPVVASLMPWRLFKDMFYVGTSEIFGRHIFFGLPSLIARTLKLVPVDPDSNLVNAMRAGAYGLRQGNNLVLYPEGERSIDGTPKRFKKGAAILATHLNVPIYPVALEGFYDAWPRNQKLPRRANLSVRFGDPIYPPESIRNPEETYKQVTEQLRNAVVDMWESMREKQNQPEAVIAGD
ncbi:MAG TPA: AMP-binding protein [Candidatus Angelobacter sp.]|nr:AMP-binding protein [Candidatus Angelobacter sp.]